jgi:hypothetical protein
MAKAEQSRRVNKSQAIRDVFAADPKADSKTVIARAAEAGVKVTPTMVYYVRSKLGKAARKAKRESVAAVSRNPIELVIRVKGLAAEVGGIGNLKKLVDLLAE